MKMLLLLMACTALLAQVESGILPAAWNTEATGWLVHQYNSDFYILRQSGASHYE